MASGEETIVLRLQAVNEADAALGKATQQINELKKSLEETNKRTRDLAAANNAQWTDSAKAGAKTFETLQKGYGALDMAQAKSRQAHEAYAQALAKLGAEGSKHLKGIGDELAHHVTKFVSAGVAIEAMRRGFEEYAKSTRGFERVRMETGATAEEVHHLKEAFEALSAITGKAVPAITEDFRKFADASQLSSTQTAELFAKIELSAHAAGTSTTAMAKAVTAAMTNLKVPLTEIDGVMNSWIANVPSSMQAAFGDALQNISPMLRTVGVEGRAAADQFGVHFAAMVREFGGNTGKAESAITQLLKKVTDWKAPLGKFVLPEIEKFRGDADAYNKIMGVTTQTLDRLGLLDDRMTLAQRSLFMSKYGVTEEDITTARQFREEQALLAEIIAKTGVSADEAGRRLKMMSEGPQKSLDEMNAKFKEMYDLIGQIFTEGGISDALVTILKDTVAEVRRIVAVMKEAKDLFNRMTGAAPETRSAPPPPPGLGTRKTGGRLDQRETGLPLQPGEAEAKAESDRIIAEEDAKRDADAGEKAKKEAENLRIKEIRDARAEAFRKRENQRRAARGLPPLEGTAPAPAAPPHHATGGEFTVPGSGRGDEQPVSFMGTPGERVTVESIPAADTRESLQRQQDKADIAMREHFARFRGKSDTSGAEMISKMLRPEDRSGGPGTGFDKSGRFVGVSEGGVDPATGTRTGTGGARSRPPMGREVDPRRTTAPAAPKAKPTGPEGTPATIPGGTGLGPPVGGGFVPGPPQPELSIKPNHNDLNRDAYEKLFGNSPLADKYDSVVAAADRNNMPASLVAGIIASETGWGKVTRGNNPAGLMDPKDPSKKLQYPDLDAGIEAAARTQQRTFVKGGETIGGMAKIYSPPGARNDKYGTNAQWPGLVTGAQQRLSTGLPEPESQKQARAAQFAERDAAIKRGESQISVSAVTEAIKGRPPPPGGVRTAEGVRARGELLSVAPNASPDVPAGSFSPQKTPVGGGGGGRQQAQLSIDEALKLEGLNESRDRDVLKEYMQTGGRNLTGSQNAWCARFVNAMVTKAGLPGNEGSWAAKSFLNWGKSVGAKEEPQALDVAVFNRGSPGSGQGHVGALTGKTRVNEQGVTEYEMLQGNIGGEKKGGGEVGTTWITRGGGQGVAGGGRGAPIDIRRGTAAEPPVTQLATKAVDPSTAVAGPGAPSTLDSSAFSPAPMKQTAPENFRRIDRGPTGFRGGRAAAEEATGGGVAQAKAMRSELERPIEPVIKPRMQQLGPPSLRWSRHTARQQQTDQSRHAARSSHTDAGFA